MDISKGKSWTSGRLNPPHIDHCEGLFETMHEKGKFAIAIVQSPRRNAYNPFTFEEISEIIHTLYSLDEVHIFPFYIKWTSLQSIINGRNTIKFNVPQRAKYYGGDWHHKFLAKFNGYDLGDYERGTFTNASEVRKSFYEDVIKRPSYERTVRPWRKLVHPKTIPVFEKYLKKPEVQQALADYDTTRNPLERLVGAK